MRTEEFDFKYGKIIVDTNEAGKEGYRLQDKDFQMQFIERG